VSHEYVQRVLNLDNATFVGLGYPYSIDFAIFFLLFYSFLNASVVPSVNGNTNKQTININLLFELVSPHVIFLDSRQWRLLSAKKFCGSADGCTVSDYNSASVSVNGKGRY
jgi:hypothetical protein